MAAEVSIFYPLPRVGLAPKLTGFETLNEENSTMTVLNFSKSELFHFKFVLCSSPKLDNMRLR